jgi:hypothetical protein
LRFLPGYPEAHPDTIVEDAAEMDKNYWANIAYLKEKVRGSEGACGLRVTHCAGGGVVEGEEQEHKGVGAGRLYVAVGVEEQQKDQHKEDEGPGRRETAVARGRVRNAGQEALLSRSLLQYRS